MVRIHTPDGGPFSDTDQRFAEKLCQQMGICIERLRRSWQEQVNRTLFAYAHDLHKAISDTAWWLKKARAAAHLGLFDREALFNAAHIGCSLGDLPRRP